MNNDNLKNDDTDTDIFKQRLTWELLLETNRDISSILDLHELLTVISQRTSTLLDADDCVIFRLEEDGISLHPIMGHGEFAEQSMSCSLQGVSSGYV